MVSKEAYSCTRIVQKFNVCPFRTALSAVEYLRNAPISAATASAVEAAASRGSAVDACAAVFDDVVLGEPTNSARFASPNEYFAAAVQHAETTRIAALDAAAVAAAAVYDYDND